MTQATLTDRAPNIDAWFVGDPAGERIIPIPLVRGRFNNWELQEVIETHEYGTNRLTGRAFFEGTRGSKPIYVWRPARPENPESEENPR